MKKAEYPKIVTVVHNLLLNYQPNYNSNRKSQSQGVGNQLVFTQPGNTGDGEDEAKEEK